MHKAVLTAVFAFVMSASVFNDACTGSKVQASDRSALDETYAELYGISRQWPYGNSQEWPGQHDPMQILDRMLAFISEHSGYEPATGLEGLSLIGNLPNVLYKLPLAERPAAEHRILDSVQELLRHDGLDARMPRLAARVELEVAFAMQHGNSRPDVSRVREKLDRYIDVCDDQDEARYSIMDLRQRYADLLASVDIEAAMAYVRPLSRSSDGHISRWALELLDQLRWRRVPMEMAFTALDGRQVDLARLRGKVVLINFTGITWCYGCRIQEPYLKMAYDKYHAAGFEILSITNESSSGKLEAVEKLIADRELSWPHYFDGLGMKNPYVIKYRISYFPTLWLLDKKGLLVSTAPYGEQLQLMIQRCLTQPALAPAR